MTLPAMPAFIGGQAVEDRLIRSPLKIYVERGENFQASFVHLVGSIFILEIAANFLYEIWSQRIRIVRQMQIQGRRARGSRLRGRDFAVFQHGVEDQIAPLHRAVGMVNRRIYGRPLGQTREHGSFLKGQLLRRLAEVKLRRGLETVGAVSQSDLVCVERENLRLGEAPFDLDGQHRFLYLAMKRAVGREE